MRTAPQHADFSILRPVQPDPRDNNAEPFDKMRFMGLFSDMLKEQPVNSGLREVIAVQQCGALGICQTESFTFGGIHCARKRHVVRAVEVPGSPVVQEDFATFSGTDMIQCGPMGYVDSSETTMCILDPLVSPLAYILEGIKQAPLVPPALSNACQEVFHAPGTLSPDNGYHVDVTQGLIRYSSGRQYVEKFKTLLNSYIITEAKVMRADALGSAHDRRVLSAQLVACGKTMHRFIETNTRGDEMYGRHHVQGLYVFLDWGSYEVPIFWWLKMGLGKWVFQTADSLAIVLADLETDVPVELSAFDKRIGLMPGSNDLNIAESTSVLEFWSRINANELDIFEKTQQTLARTLSRKIEIAIGTLFVGGCVEVFTVDDTKVRELRILADPGNARLAVRRKKHQIEAMMHEVYASNPAPPPASVMLWAANGKTLPEDTTKKSLGAKMQYDNNRLLDPVNGLDSLLAFDPNKFTDFASLFPGIHEMRDGFLHFMIQRMLTDTNTLDEFSPLHSASARKKLQLYAANDKKGIKILRFDVEALLRQLEADSSTQRGMKTDILEYLALFDRTFEESPAGAALPEDPVAAFTVRPRNIALRPRAARCIFDKHDLQSLNVQASFSTFTTGPHVTLGIGDQAYEQAMCMPTANVQKFGHTHPGPGIDSHFSSRLTPAGGRCTLRDLGVYGPHTPFSSEPHSAGDVAPVPFTTFSDLAEPLRCFDRRDNQPPTTRAPEVDTSHASRPIYAGQHNLPEGYIESASRAEGVCVRIDSGCVTNFDKSITAALFNLAGAAAPHPVKLRYNSLEKNAYNQVNGRMWNNLQASAKNNFRSQRGLQPGALPDDLYDANLDFRNMMYSAQEQELYSTAGPDASQNHKTCGLKQMTWSAGLNVTAYVLNPLFAEAQFSHVIYNDRVLMRRKYSDSSEQQLFGHHFVGGEDSRDRFYQTTSPTPLFSHCPGLSASEPATAMHYFKKVSLTHGKDRMHERFHRFNQDILVNPDLTRTAFAKTVQPGEIFRGYANDQLNFMGSDCEKTNLWWGAGGFFDPSKDFYRTRGSMFLLFFKSTFRWTSSASFSSSRTQYDTSVTRGPLLDYNFIGPTSNPSGPGPTVGYAIGSAGLPDCFDYRNRRAQLTERVKNMDSRFISSTPCQAVPPGFSLCWASRACCAYAEIYAL